MRPETKDLIGWIIGSIFVAPAIVFGGWKVNRLAIQHQSSAAWETSWTVLFVSLIVAATIWGLTYTAYRDWRNRDG